MSIPKRKKHGGRVAGTPNRLNAQLKDMILQAAETAHPEGTVGYLTAQAIANPAAFMTLLGKVLPMQVTGPDGGPVQISRVERVIVRSTPNPDS